jgi:hypothetical protein
MATRKSAAAERRWLETVARLEGAKQERERRIAPLRASVVRNRAARGTRAEVEAVDVTTDPDASVVEVLRGEREARRAGRA